MRVTILGLEPDVASTRYRAIIPAKYLKDHGVELCADGDLLIVGKHGFDPSICDTFKAVIFDICDDHFQSSFEKHYREMCVRATEITCNSDIMRYRIHKETGRVATVIPDPYEHEELEPSWGEGMLWFGHPSNLGDLFRVLPTLRDVKVPLGVISAHTDSMPENVRNSIVPWSPTALDKGFKSCQFVIIPTGKGPAKSANRLIESVRAGKFVIAEPLPAYEEFGRWMWIGDIREGVEWAKTHKSDCLRRTADCQRYIAKRFSPDKVGYMWHELIKKVYPWAQSIRLCS